MKSIRDEAMLRRGNVAGSAGGREEEMLPEQVWIANIPGLSIYRDF